MASDVEETGRDAFMRKDSESIEEVLVAGAVYVVMKDNYRISRNRRAEWFFSRINSVVTVPKALDLDHLKDEITVISVVPHNPSRDWSPSVMTDYKYEITSGTVVHFLAKKYRFVFCLDISPSVASVDLQTGEVMFDRIYHALQASLEGLVQPFHVPGSNIIFCPKIYLTVIAHTPFLAPVSDQVLVQGIAVTPNSLKKALDFVFERLAAFETSVAEITNRLEQSIAREQQQSSYNNVLGSIRDDQDRRYVNSNVAMPSDLGFVDLLRQALIALHLLPENSTAGIIVITDGVINVPNGEFLEIILSQLRYNTVPCSFIQLSSQFHPHLCYGTIPYADFMKFIASATFGTYLTSITDVNSDSLEMNIYQNAFLCWSFFKPWEDSKTEMPFKGKAWLISRTEKNTSFVKDMPIIRNPQSPKNLEVDYLKVLSCRLREGFTIKEVRVMNDSIEIKLCLSWKFLNNIEYVITTAIPSQSQVSCAVTIEGPYDFLHDLTCLAKKRFDSHYRELWVRRFFSSQRLLDESDQLLVRFNSFSSDPSYYNVPDSLKNGVPLFYMQANSTTPILTTSEFNTSQTQSSMFAEFWKPVCMLDTSLWQKWMHTHSIRILLEHDFPLPASLHIPNASGRYQAIQCRQAIMTLNTFLKDWSSFVLVENTSYVKLLFDDLDKPPTSFYIIRVASKPPCVVLRLAFLVGSPGHLRHQVVTSLKKELYELSYPQRLKDAPTDWKGFTSDGKQGSPRLLPKIQRKSPRKLWQRSCCTVFQKPIEKILIRYERVPRNFLRTLLPQASYHSSTSPRVHNHQQSTFGFRPTFHSHLGTSAKMGPEMFNTVARYLHHRRWIWSIQSCPVSLLPLSCASHILSTLEKIRLKEGFQFAYSAAGTATMVMELQMEPKFDNTEDHEQDDTIESTPFVLQYIVFPPTHSLARCDEEDEVEGESESADDHELHIVTECWIEPQSGVIAARKGRNDGYMIGSCYKDIPKTMFDIDEECISTLVTFEHMSLMCMDRRVPSPMRHYPASRFSNTTRNKDIQVVPFAFDLKRILPKSQNGEVIFSMLIQDLSSAYLLQVGERIAAYHDQANNHLYDKLVANFSSIHDREVILSEAQNLEILKLIRSNENCSVAWENADREMTKRFPKLKCFIKKLDSSSSHVILTLIPAEYSDLKLLMLPNGISGDRHNDKTVLLIEDRNLIYGHEEGGEPSLHSFEDYLDSNIQLTSTPVVAKEMEFGNLGDSPNHDTAALLLGRKRSRVKSGGESGPIAKRPLKRTTVLDDSFRLRAGSMETFWKAKVGVRSRTKSADDKHYTNLASPEDVQSPGGGGVSQGAHCESWVRQICMQSQESLSESLAFMNTHKPQYGSVSLPIFCFDCSLTQLTDHVTSGEGKAKLNLYLDNRIHHPIYEDEEVGAGNTDETDEEAEDISDLIKKRAARRNLYGDERILRSLFAALETAWKKSYLYGIYESLQRNTFICAADIDVAVSLCEETKIEVSLSEFLNTICSHLKSFEKHRNSKSKGFEEGDSLAHDTTSSSCMLMDRIQDFIKKRFQNAISATFNNIHNAPDVFHLRQADSPQICRDLHETSSKQTSDYEVESLTVKADSLSTDFQAREEDQKSKRNSLDSDEESSQGCSKEFIIQATEEISSRDDSTTKIAPLFLQLKCSIKTEEAEFVTKLKDFPTCIDDLVRQFDESEALEELDLTEAKLNLEFVVLTVPVEVEEIEHDLDGRIRTLSTCSTSSALTPSEEQLPVFGETAGTRHNGSESGSRCRVLPSSQMQAVKRTVDNVRWLLRDEITSCLSEADVVTEHILNMVASHVKKSLGKPGCQLHVFPLHFVNKAFHTGFEKFKERFRHMSIDGYSLQEKNSWFFVVGNGKQFASLRSPEDELNKLHALKATKSDDATTISTEPFNESAEQAPVPELQANQLKPETLEQSDVIEAEQSSVKKKRLLMKGSSHHSDASSAAESINADDAYDGDESEFGVEEVTRNDPDPSGSEIRPPPFWLIFRFTSEQVNVFFHCRYNEEDLSVYTYASNLMDKAVKSIADLRRLVNQDLLLQQLHDTRQCSPLLEHDTNEMDIWDVGEAFPVASPARLSLSLDEHSAEYPDRSGDSALEFVSGMFSCKVVWETKFILHPRLRTGPSKSVVSRGIQTLRATLIAFEVANRKNMFVYRDSTGNVYYMRLYRMQGEPQLNAGEFNPESESMESSSYSSKDMAAFEQAGGRTPEDVVLLQVHGISDVGSEIKEQLVQSLRNKLDDSVLDILSVTLERNPHCKLTPEDVRFIQKPMSKPDAVFKFGVNPTALKNLSAFSYYLHQNILQFLNIPKYTDAKPENRFRDYTRLNEEGETEKIMYLYNQSPGGTGSKGIACLAVDIIDELGVKFSGSKPSRPVFEAHGHKVSASEFESLIETEEILEATEDQSASGTTIEIKLWKQGRMNFDLVRGFFLKAIKQCLWDLQMEFYFLTAPTTSAMNFRMEALSEPTTPMLSEGLSFTSKHDFSEGRTLLRSTSTFASLKYSSIGTNTDTGNTNTGRAALERRNSANLPSMERSGPDAPRARSMSVSARKPATSVEYKFAGRASPIPSATNMLSSSSFKSKHSLDTGYFDQLRSESRDDGRLHGNYTLLMKEWCEFGNQLSVPSLRMCTTDLMCRLDAETIAVEVEKIISSVAPDNSPRLFWRNDINGIDQYITKSKRSDLIPEDNEERNDEELRQLKKSLKHLRSFEKQDEVEYPNELAQLFAVQENFCPSKLPSECLIVSQNIQHWRLCVSAEIGLEHWGYAEVPKNCYKFSPLYSSNSDYLAGGSPSSTSLDQLSRVSSTTQLPGSGGDSDISGNRYPFLVPRQRLLLCTVTDKQIIFTFYNWSKETIERVLEHTRCLALWSNARSALFTSIFTQKSGCFLNQAIQRFRPLQNLSVDGNPYIGGVIDAETLVRHPGPPKELLPSRLGNLKRTRQAHTFSAFLECYRNMKHSTQLKPPEPNTPYFHGEQLVENRLLEKRDNQNSVFEYWLLRGLNASNMIGYDAVYSYKQAARVIHYVMTPIIFLTRWRSEVAATRDSYSGTLKKAKLSELRKQRMIRKADTSRSRHGSGTSQQSLETKGKSKPSLWGLWGAQSATSSSDTMVSSMTSSTTSLLSSKKLDEKWHATLCDAFIQEYMQYLQSLGFIPLQGKTSNRQRIPSKRETENDRTRHVSGASYVSLHSSASSQSGSSSQGFVSGGSSRRHREDSGDRVVHYLQKSLPGGILLFEIGLCEPFFFAKLYGLEAVRIQIKKTRKDLHHGTMEFLAECEKIKTIMHLHSFTYDFHLRSIHSYLSGRQLIFKQGYHLTNFLLDFIKYYPKGPNFARNIVHVGAVTIQYVTTFSHILYNYIVDHEKLYGMEVVRMAIPLQDNFSEPITEFVLKKISTKRVHFTDKNEESCYDEFDETLLVCHDVPPQGKPLSMDPSTLRLKYFIILSSPREMFPKAEVESSRGKISIVNNIPEALTKQQVMPAKVPDIAPTPSRRSSLSEITLQPNAGTDLLSRETNEKQYEGIIEEQVNYMGYFSSHEQMMQNIMKDQVLEVEREIESMVKTASEDCRRDLLWKRLLFGGYADEKLKNKKEDLNFRETSGALTYWEFVELQELVIVQSLTEMDQRLQTLLTQRADTSEFFKNLLGVLAVKHKQNYRFFTNPDNPSQHHMAVYSPKVMNCAILLDIYSEKAELKILFKEPPKKPATEPSIEIGLEPDVVEMIESVINACCYCCWARLVDPSSKN